MLQENRDLIEAGGAIVVLRPRDKRPVDAKWTELERWTWDEASKYFPAGHNIGIRLGKPSEVNGRFIHGIDLDLRDESRDSIREAYDALEAIIGDPARFNSVRTGSGGKSRHFYFCTDEAFRPRKLKHSAHKVVGQDGKQHWGWEIDLGGTGRQFVLPPSIHPITRQPYTWDGEPDWRELRFVPSAEVRSWLPADTLSTGKTLDAELSDLATWWRQQPRHFAEAEITDILDGLTAGEHGRAAHVEDREGWLRVGMALHHQYEGSEKGFERWCAFSAESDKFDEEDQWRVWRSFAKTSGSANPVTMATLLRSSRAERLAEESGSNPPPGWLHPEDGEDDFAPLSPRRLARERRDALLDGLGEEGDTGLPPEDWESTLRDALIDARRDEEYDADAWKHELDYTENGVSIRTNVHNIALVVANDWRLKGWLGFNDFIGEQVQCRPLKVDSVAMMAIPQKDTANGDLLKREHEHNLRLFLAKPRVGKRAGYGINATDRDLKTAVVAACYQNRFHPVRAYLNRLQWDGVERLHRLFSHYLGTPDEPYHREVARLVMVAAVTRIYEPGHKFDNAVILEGPEGLRKSSFVRALASRDTWFGEMHGTFADRKALVEQMMGKWIVEMPELSGFGKSDVEAVKAFMSANSDNVRLAYEARSAQFDRQCVFWGSTNDQQYLKSNTGNRRFFPVKVRKSIDTDELRREVDQLWAEAVVRYGAMRRVTPLGTLPLYLKGEAAKGYALALQVEKRVDSVSDIMAGIIGDWANTPNTPDNITGTIEDKMVDHKPHFLPVKMCAAQMHVVVSAVLSPGQHRPATHSDVTALNLAMRVLEWEPAILTFPGFGKQRGFRRPGATEAELKHGYMDARRLEE